MDQKLAAVFLCKLVDDNPQAQEKLCDALGVDLIFGGRGDQDDGIARVSLSKIPPKFK